MLRALCSYGVHRQMLKLPLKTDLMLAYYMYINVSHMRAQQAQGTAHADGVKASLWQNCAKFQASMCYIRHT